MLFTLIGLIVAHTASAGELDYVQRTSPVTVTATTVGTAQTILAGGSFNGDGATSVLVEAYSPAMSPMSLELFDGAVDKGTICRVTSATVPARCQFRFVPSAGSHTLTLKAFTISGSPVLDCGGGGAATMVPCFMRTTDQAGVMTTAACTNSQPCNVAIDSLYNDVDATVTNFPAGFNVNNLPSNQNVTCTSGCSSAGTFELASDDSAALNLTWWGVWAGVGVLLALLIVPRLMSRFRFWDER